MRFRLGIRTLTRTVNQHCTGVRGIVLKHFPQKNTTLYCRPLYPKIWSNRVILFYSKFYSLAFFLRDNTLNNHVSLGKWANLVMHMITAKLYVDRRPINGISVASLSWSTKICKNTNLITFFKKNMSLNNSNASACRIFRKNGFAIYRSVSSIQVRSDVENSPTCVFMKDATYMRTTALFLSRIPKHNPEQRKRKQTPAASINVQNKFLQRKTMSTLVGKNEKMYRFFSITQRF